MEKSSPQAQHWEPDCLDSCLGCWKRSPKTKAATGYYLLRIIFSIVTVHSAIIFASVITYAALQVTNCISTDSGSEDSCSTEESDDGDDGKRCVRLWGIIKPDSLLTIIGTVASIILAVSAAIVGTAMDVTPYRRQIGLFGNVMMTIGMLLCLTIINPNDATLLISAIGLMLVLVFKDYVQMQYDSYAPELSAVPAEIGSAVSGGFTWSLIANVLLIIVWSIIGMGLSNSAFGFAVTIGSAILLVITFTGSYRRLPDVPAAHPLPAGETVWRYTLLRFTKLLREAYNSYPDLGTLLLAGMIFDPALTALFAAAVLILISKYHFTANQVTYVLGLAIVAAIPAVPLSRWIASTSRLTWLFQDANDPGVVAPEDEGVGEIENNDAAGQQDEGGDIEMTHTEQHATCSDTLTRIPDPAAATDATTELGDLRGEAQAVVKKPVFHPHRIRSALVGALGLTILTTILVVQILTACNFGLACVFGCIWGFLLSFCWNCFAMLRISLVPGGRESEFAGLYLTLFSCMVWLPLFVFSIANEVWSIDGALYILTIFFGLGALVLLFVDLERALETKQGTLSQRRWAHVLLANAAVQGSAKEAPGMQGRHGDGTAAVALEVSEHGTAEGSSGAGGSMRYD